MMLNCVWGTPTEYTESEIKEITEALKNGRFVMVNLDWAYAGAPEDADLPTYVIAPEDVQEEMMGVIDPDDAMSVLYRYMKKTYGLICDFDYSDCEILPGRPDLATSCVFKDIQESEEQEIG